MGRKNVYLPDDIINHITKQTKEENFNFSKWVCKQIREASIEELRQFCRPKTISHYIGLSLMRQIKERDKFCVYCGDEITCADHIIPKSKGGTTNINNLVGACSHCNCSKNNKNVAHFCYLLGVRVPGIITELLQKEVGNGQ